MSVLFRLFLRRSADVTFSGQLAVKTSEEQQDLCLLSSFSLAEVERLRDH